MRNRKIRKLDAHDPLIVNLTVQICVCFTENDECEPHPRLSLYNGCCSRTLLWTKQQQQPSQSRCKFNGTTTTKEPTKLISNANAFYLLICHFITHTHTHTYWINCNIVFCADLYCLAQARPEPISRIPSRRHRHHYTNSLTRHTNKRTKNHAHKIIKKEIISANRLNKKIKSLNFRTNEKQLMTKKTHDEM